MCGIFGVLRFDGGPADDRALQGMARAMRHRGPDGDARWQAGPCGLGYVRLATVGLRQPAQVFAAGAVRSVVNGEVYGHAAVARSLGFPVPAVDTHLLAMVAARDAAAGVLRVPGTFAAAWWDGDGLWLARDRVGKKPLFYVVDGRAVWFASEIKALVAAGALDVAADDHAVGKFLFQGSLEESTPLLRGVHVVTPGTAVGWTREGTARTAHAPPWNLADGTGGEADGLEAHFTAAVDRRLPDEVTAVTLFSGGLDSSLVAARARMPLVTIAVPESDETQQATRVARKLGLRLEVVAAPPRDRAWLRRALFHLETPDASAAYAMAPAVLAAADVLGARGVRVALGGEGADEVFLGYPWHRLALALERGVDPPARVDSPVVRRAMQLLGWSGAAGRPLRALEAWLWSGGFAEVAATLYAGQPVAPVDEPTGPCDPGTPVPHGARQRQLDALRRDMLLLPVLHADRLLAAAGVESRLPFLDDALVAWMLTAPAHRLERMDRDKPLLRTLARRVFPGFRPAAKRGFTAPRRPPDDVLEAWTRARAAEGVRCLDLARLLADPMLRGPARAEALWRAFLVEETLDVLWRGPGETPRAGSPTSEEPARA
ncbi:MAG: hypothetical protein HY904_14680 [Deltaproteobacteria bacterium]|nr:hypothetical protein [Deltaproteobacteria bacterium]